MLRITLGFMRRAIPRLVAAAVAIMIGTAFVAGTLFASSAAREVAYRAATAWLGNADLVLWSGIDWLTPKDETALDDVPGVEVAQPQITLWGDVSAGTRSEWLGLTVADHEINGYTLAEGRWPESPDEVALQSGTAQRLDVRIGDEITARAQVFTADEDEFVTADVTVVGIIDDPGGLLSQSTVAIAERSMLSDWSERVEGAVVYPYILVGITPGADVDEVAERIAEAMPDAIVETAAQLADQEMEFLTGTTDAFTAMVLGFAALAMFVAGIVITNTFQVLVAQRTRQVALLRCIGATSRQIRGSVVTEGLILGLGASTAGILLAAGLIQIGLYLAGDVLPDISGVFALPLAPVAIASALLTGTGVTVLAALAPARAATRVAPLAALRPPPPPRSARASRRRLVTAGSFAVVGLAMLLGAIRLSSDQTQEYLGDMSQVIPMMLGVLGGCLSFTGVMLATVVVAPVLVRSARRLSAMLGGGPTFQLAATNVLRNPRRTAATANALLIGVTLVMTMATGAVTLRGSLDRVLGNSYPADAQVMATAITEDLASLTDEQIEIVTSHPDVSAWLLATTTWVTIEGVVPGDPWILEAVGVDASLAADVFRDSRDFADLDDQTALVAPWVTESADLTGDTVTLRHVDPASYDWDLDGVAIEELPAVTMEASFGHTMVASVTLTLDALARLDPDAPTQSLFLRFDDDADAAQVLADLQDALAVATVDAGGGLDTAPWVNGPALARQAYDQIIDAILLIVVALLAVAVVIALVGVANTLSLSVIERRRESAVLRALGLTRAGLRGMLAVEGLLLTLVGVSIGVVLGLCYGWAGATVLFADVDGLRLRTPWGYIGGITVIAAVAGVLASVIPARNAVRSTPVEALGGR